MKNYIKVLLASALLIGCAPQSVDDAAASPEKADAESVVSIYDQLAPPVSERMQSPSMLLFSKTRSWRHEAGIAGANMHMIKLSRKMEYGTFSTENGAIFNDEDLAKFEIVVMNNFTGDGLSPAQEAALQRWLEAGGGILALHGAGDASHNDWPWYDVDVIGPDFIGHPAAPQFQDARIENLSSSHPVMTGVPLEWVANDEWYSFDSLPDENFTVLAGLDESTYSPVNTQYGDVSDLRMGEGAENHPIIWSRCIGAGRIVFSALGHLETTYEEPNYQVLLENAARWVAKETDSENGGC